MTRRLLLLTAFVAGQIASAGLTVVHAQETRYPTMAVRIVVPSPPGGPVDVVGRVVAQHLADVLGTAVAENRPGAAGVLATRLVINALPDGHTVLIAANSMLAVQKANRNAGYDVERDLIPLLTMGWIPNIMVASPTLPASSVREVIDLSRSRKLNYGTIGVGSTTHIMTEYLFGVLARTSIQHVPYPGASAALTALMSNQLDLASVAMLSAVPLVKAKKITALAVTSNRRVSALPNVPTLAEAGFPGNDYITWVGFFVPAKTPRPIADRFTEAVLKVSAMPDTKERLAASAFEIEPRSGEDFRRQVSDELKKWATVIETTGIKLD
jgi:tripartite-type tricarboxylate transporter receptor subunit TctC